MFEQQSIKTTLQSSIVVFSLFLALLFMLLMLSYAWVVEDNVFNRLVTSEAQYITQQYQLSGEIAVPRQSFMTLYPGWHALSEQVQLLHQYSPERVEFPADNGGTLHLQSVTLGSTEWVLAADVSAFEVTRDYLPKLLPYLTFALLLVLALAYLLSRYLAGKITQPLQYITQRVQQHNSGTALQLNSKLPNNEIGYLAQTIQRYINQLQTALARETDFTRDISHELRTPATVLKMVLNRLEPAAPLDDASLVKLKQAAQQMEQTIHALLALAREESMQHPALCLLEEIECCLVNNPGLMRQRDLQLQLQVAADYRINANKNLLHILLNNIIDNALTHGSASQIEISLAGNTLTIANPMTADCPTDLLIPGVKSDNSSGIGQGLHIVNRICQRNQWQLTSRQQANWFYLSIEF
mgnify:FL=1